MGTNSIKAHISRSSKGFRGPCSEAIDAARHGDTVTVTIDHELIAGTSTGIVFDSDVDQLAVRFGAPVPARAVAGITGGGLTTLYLDDDDMAHRHVTSWVTEPRS